jgi:hypothetical protein
VLQEDWLNVELLAPPSPPSPASPAKEGGDAGGLATTASVAVSPSSLVVINGQLDKLRDGYYNKVKKQLVQ